MSVNTSDRWSAHARDAVWAGGLARVKTFKCGEGEEEPTVFGSGPCRWHYIVLKARKEVVSFVWEQDVGVCDEASFVLVILDCL